jgi:hypothetical protein
LEASSSQELDDLLDGAVGFVVVLVRD